MLILALSQIAKETGLTYVNNACHLFQQNIVAVQYRRKIWYRVVRPIAPGDELLTHYGGPYSKTLGIHKNFRLSKDVCKKDEDGNYENPSDPTNLKSSQGELTDDYQATRRPAAGILGQIDR